MISSSDHRTRLTGAAFSMVKVSWNAGAFQDIDLSDVDEVGNGDYSIPALALGNYPTYGPLLIHAEASGADPYDTRFEIVPNANAKPLVLGSTTYPLTFLLVSSSDHITGATTLFSISTRLSKAGGVFAGAVGTAAHLGFGNWYIAPAAANYDTAGSLALSVSAAGADSITVNFDVAPAVPVPVVPTGTNMLRVGLAWLTDQLTVHASEAITYVDRDGNEISCRATLGKKLLKLDDGAGGFQIVWTDLDFLIRASDLVVAGLQITPRKGDRIFLAINSEIQEFEVASYSGEPHWTWADPHQSMRRVHANYVAVEANT